MGSQLLQSAEPDPDVITAAESQLRQRYPDVEGDLVHASVTAVYDRLTPAKVRTFLPILIVRQVSDDLRHLHRV